MMAYVLLCFGDWALNSDWSLQYNIVERAATRFNICCMLQKMCD